MLPTHAIMVSKKDTQTYFEGNTHTKYFTKDQIDNGEMQKFIELKTNAGFICSEFNLSATYGIEPRLVKQ